MRWIRWTMLTVLGMGPVWCFADEPAQKKGETPKLGLRVEVQSDGAEPKVFQLGTVDEQAKEIAAHFKKLADKEGTFTLTLQLNEQQPQIGEKPHPGQPLNPQPGAAIGNKPAGPNNRVAQWHVAQVKHEKGTYLGITTDAPPPVLRKQLGLAKGMGLVIDHVMPDSPAAKAGLAEFDVLQKLDDQLIVNQPQLTVLVRNHKPGDEVKVTVIRDAKPTTVTVKLIEHDIEVGMEGQEFIIKAAMRDMLGQLPQGAQGWQMLERRNPLGGGFQPGAARPASKTLVEGDRTYTLTLSPWGKSYTVTEGKDHRIIFTASVATEEAKKSVPADMKAMLEKLERSMPSTIQLSPKPLPPGASPQSTTPNPNPALKPKKDKDGGEK